MRNKCWIAVVVLLAVCLGMVYKFMLQGSVQESSDGRTAIVINGGERDLVLAEMRAFLESIQQITQALTVQDMEAVAVAAAQVGRAAQAAVPGTLLGKLPLEFKQLGFDTHNKFDLLAMDAREMGDSGQALTQLTTLMHNCVACHRAYRLETVAATDL